MKTIKKFMLSLLVLLFLINVNSFAQGRHGNKGNHGNNGNRGNHFNRNGNIKYSNNKQRIYKNRSVYRPKNFHNYRPIWAHHQNFNRRWVYFPQRNFYYDNWRQVYFFKSNNIWRMNVNLPPSFIVVNLEDEKHYELSDEDDEMDSIYVDNK